MAKGKRVNQCGRSKGEVKHIRHYVYELVSPAYRELSCVARALYTEIKSFYNGSNNGEIFLSVRMAADRLGVSDNTANKALNALQAHGFIKPRVKGSFTRKVRHATTWELTEYPLNNVLPTRDYQTWHMAGRKQNTVSEFAPTVLESDTDKGNSNQSLVS